MPSLFQVSEEILSLQPYKPGKPISEAKREYQLPKVVKLASNENPLGPSPKAIEAMRKALDFQHRYPDPTSYDLLEALQMSWNMPKERLCVGNGSNELIDLMIRIFCAPGESIVTTEMAFVAYQVCAQAARVKRHFTPQMAGFKADLKAMAAFLKANAEKEKIRLAFIPNPNNPTGTYANKEQIKTFLAEVAGIENLLVVFDEAYNEFVRAKDYVSASAFASQYKNVAVIRTLSKAYGLAGLRVGVLAADSEVIDLVNRVRNPFNVNDLAQVAAIAALQDPDFVQRTTELTWKGLDYFYAELKGMGLPFIESQANFVLFDTLRDVTKVNESLLRQGIILRPVQNYGLKTHMRMSVGLPEENASAIAALKKTLQEVPKL